VAAPRGSVVALGGIDSEYLRRLLDQFEAQRDSPRALFARMAPASTTEAVIEQVINLLSCTARRLWPIWFTDLDFGECRNGTLGRLAATAMARRAAAEIAGLSFPWVEAAVGLALDDRPPRVKGTLPAVELAQLALTVSRCGLVLITDVEAARAKSNSATLVHALEWIAHHAHVAVVALFPELPSIEPPFDRILYGARHVLVAADEQIGRVNAGVPANTDDEPWLAPWLGSPHPLSETEQRLAKALGADIELSPLFGCNQFVDTVRGSRPKVDLVWMHGRLVVEIDGYGSHGNRAAFMYDRHRDYELTLSGYTVLRLANDEIAQDIEKAVEKIRDIVHLCRDRMT
jgi:very-short-patch-repair endonuclease